MNRKFIFNLSNLKVLIEETPSIETELFNPLSVPNKD